MENFDEKHRAFVFNTIYAEEQSKCLTYLTRQQFQTQNITQWVDKRTEMQMRQERIRSKIAELTPQLYLKSDLDYNYIDRQTAKIEERATKVQV